MGNEVLDYWPMTISHIFIYLFLVIDLMINDWNLRTNYKETKVRHVSPLKSTMMVQTGKDDRLVENTYTKTWESLSVQVCFTIGGP